MDDDALLSKIRALIAVPDADDRSVLAQMEDTLTVGYARALALEAERWRLERRIGEVASGLANGAATGSADDLARLAQRMSDTDVEVVRLRSALDTLRERASAVRSAA